MTDTQKSITKKTTRDSRASQLTKTYLGSSKKTAEQKELITDIIDLYQSGQIIQLYTAENLITSVTGKSVRKATINKVKAKIASFNTKPSVIGRLTPKPEPEKKQFHVSAMVKVKKTYMAKQVTKKRTGESVTRPIPEDKRRTFVDEIPISHSFMAVDAKDAEEQFEEQLRREWDWNPDGGGEAEYVVATSLAGTSGTTVVPAMSVGSQMGIPMRSSTHCKFAFIPEDTKHLKNEDTCVIDNLVGIYNKYFPIMTREWLINKCQKYSGVQTSLLDKDLDPEDQPIYVSDQFGKLQPNNISLRGISTWEITKVCQELQISMYAFDISCKCFHKFIAEDRKNHMYPSLVYFCVNNHMYLIDKDAKTEAGHNYVQSLIKQARDIEVNVQSCLVREEENKEKKNIFNGDLPIVENIPIQDLHDYDKHIIIYPTTCLNEQLQDIIRYHNFIPSKMQLRYKNFKCVKIHYTNGGRNIFLFSDPNQVHQLDYKDIREICEKTKVEFRNQSISSLLKEIRDKFEKPIRHIFSQEERKQIFKDADETCEECDRKMKITDMNIDHVIPLCCGGSNEPENLQVLCKKCHFVKTRDEQENNQYIKVSRTLSSFNTIVRDIFNSKACHSYAFVEKVNPIYSNKTYKSDIYTFDINKCRKNQLYYSQYEYPVFSVMDFPVKFEGRFKPGLYYVETKQYFPMRGTGWYYEPTVKYCLSENMIKEENIKYAIYATSSVPGEYFKNLIDFVYSTFGDFSKLAINSMIGCFKPKDREAHQLLIPPTTDVNTCFYHLLKDNGTNVYSFDVDETTYYQAFRSYIQTTEETEAPFYHMILEQEAIELHGLTKIIKEADGLVLDLGTDAVTCVFKKDFPFKTITKDGKKLIDGFFFDAEKKDHKYKLESKDRLKVEMLPKYIRTEQYEHVEPVWSEVNDVDDNNFKPLIKHIIESNNSIHIDGRAGTGKSTLIKGLQQELTKLNKPFIALAPTNKAARIIKGKTVHKYLCECSGKINKASNLEYVFIDEISMLSTVFYKFLITWKRTQPKLKFILAGDFQQLLPVNDIVGVDFNYKNSAALHELADGNRLQLTNCRRSDRTLFDLLDPEKISNLEKSTFGSNINTKLHLSYTNVTRKQINEIMMKKIVAQKKKKPLELKALDYDGNSQDVKLLAGMPIIARVNNVKYEIVNNQTFIIKEIRQKEGIIIVQDEDQVIEVPIDQFQHMFYVAYCLTIHKSQGTTFNEPYTLHEWKILNDRLKYVGLSRSTNIANINIA